MLNVDQLVAIIKKNLPHTDKTISLHEPYFSGNEWHYVKECLDTGWVSSVGKYVDKFEHDLAQYTGAKYAVAVVNGTSALHICYLLAGVRAGDEVLVPTLTFVGTINPISYCGAFPHFIDTEEQSLGIDPVLLDAYLQDITELRGDICLNRITGRPIRALCVMHTLGHPVDLDALVELCNKYHLALIEDAAEALGSFYKNTHVGHRGLIGALSFNGNKIMTTGGGGAILTDHAELAKQAKHMTTTAKLAHPWAFEHDQVAYNYRLPNINAALGCAQLEKLTDFITVKRRLAQQYQQAFANVAGVRFMQEPVHSRSNYWLNALLLDKSFAHLRDPLLTTLSLHKIKSRPLWNLQHTLAMYQHCPRMPLPVAENLYQRLVKLPSSVSLAINRVTETVTD
jgi:perosamine synthetase